MRAHYSSGLTKAATAVAHGAVGYVTLYDPNLERLYSFQHRVGDMESAPDLSWLDPQGQPNDQFPQFKAIARLALPESRKFLEACGKSPDEIFEAAKSGTLKGFNTPVQFKIHVVTKSEDIHSPNIAANWKAAIRHFATSTSW